MPTIHQERIENILEQIHGNSFTISTDYSKRASTQTLTKHASS